MKSSEATKVSSLRDPSRFMRITQDPWYALLIDLQDLVTRETLNFWHEEGVRTLHLPVTTSAISSPMGLGSDSLPVEIDLFGERTYLADSMQFSLEYACRIHRPGACYLMPSFRGEASDPTHLCQFYHSEVELPLGLSATMNVADRYFRTLTRKVMSESGEDLNQLANGTKHLERLLTSQEFPRIRFDDACVELEKIGKPQQIVRGSAWRSLTRAAEMTLLQHYGTPFWVTHWDHLAVPFYQAFEQGSSQAMNADFIIGCGEVIGLGERHVAETEALEALHLHQVQPEPYEWYLRMKRESPMLTSGFGMGVERYLMWVLGHDDIRDLQILPRENGLGMVP